MVRILFVCTGNVCRSPMAEAFLRHEAARLGLQLDVRSTGTHAWDGRAATIDGRQVMRELGVPMDDHRTRALDASLAEWADLIVCMAAEHARDVARDHPAAANRTFTIKELIALIPTARPSDGSREWVEELAERRDGSGPGAGDVDDPFGAREEAYRRVATEIRDLVSEFAAALAGKAVPRP